MPDVSKLNLDGTTYIIKDESARSQLETVTSDVTSMKAVDENLTSRINTLQGSVGSPLVAATAAAMTDKTKIYVYTGSESGKTAGHWYYWNGSAWTDGGVYNATAINTDKTLSVSNMAADAAVTGGKTSSTAPWVFGGSLYIFHGSYTPTLVSNVATTPKLTGFSSVTNGSVPNFGVAGLLCEADYIPVKAVDDTLDLIVYLDATVTDYVQLSRITISTASTWNPNTTSNMNIYDLKLYPGFNKVTLTATAVGGGTNTTYKWAMACTSTLAEVHKIKGLYFFTSELAFISHESDYSNTALKAGWDVPAKVLLHQYGTGISISAISANEFEIVCPNVTSQTSEQIYASCGVYVKDLFNKNAIITISVHNSNYVPSEGFNNWYIESLHLSQLYYNWNPTYNIVTINPNGLGMAEDSVFYVDLDSYGVDPDDYSEVYLTIAPLKQNFSRAIGTTLTITIRVTTKQNYVIANELLGKEVYSKDEINSLIKTSSTDLLFWGDSLTAGAGGNGTNYPGVCAAELGGLVYKNCGVGGETVHTIAARQGGNTLIIPAGNINGTYSYTEFKDVYGALVSPLRQGNGSGSSNKLYIKDIECDLSLTQTTSTSTDATYTISGYTGGSSSIPVLAKFAGSDFTGKVVVMFVGQNGGIDLDTRISLIDSMIAHIGHTRYVVMGLSSGDNATRDAEDATLLNKYGNRFFPTRKLLVNYGLTINGLTPTSTDTSNISVGTVPYSLRSDNVHLNAYGYTAVGKMLADHIRSLGYF